MAHTVKSLLKILLRFSIPSAAEQRPDKISKIFSELCPPEDVDQEVDGGVEGEGEVGQPGQPSDDGWSVLPAVWGAPALSQSDSQCADTEGVKPDVSMCTAYIHPPDVTVHPPNLHRVVVAEVNFINIRHQLQALTEDEEDDDCCKNPRHAGLLN